MTTELSALITEIQADIRSVEDNLTLFDETNFCERADAIDFLDFHVIDRIISFDDDGALQEPFVDLMQKAQTLKSGLELVDNELFLRLRTEIKSGAHQGVGFKMMIDWYVHEDVGSLPKNGLGYDHLDLFIDRLLPQPILSEEILEPEAEMVFYQKTPARVVFEMVNRANLTERDVFFDLGSGLGQVAILVKLMTEAVVTGIEFEPAYNHYAKTCVSELNLNRIGFINEDARTADYSSGSVFFLYTPFQGRIMTQVLALLEKEAQKRLIRIFTYGPCTSRIAQEKWLRVNREHHLSASQLAEFRNV